MELFRKEALESFSSRSGMSRSVRAIGIRVILFVVLLAICAAAFTLWLAFGTIYETVTVSGIIWPEQNNGAVYAVRSGTVSETVVSRGDTVKSGDILAFIPQEDILSEIEEAKKRGAPESEIEELHEEYDRDSVIRSNIDGIVTYIAEENSYISEGVQLASVVPYSEDGNNKLLTAYIPSDRSGMITQGMEVQVMPDFAPREEYGYIKAYVSGISTYPVTGERVIGENSLFVSLLDESQTYLQVEITLIPDMTAKSGIKWSNPQSGDIDAVMGTVCTADIVMRKCRPFEWLF